LGYFKGDWAYDDVEEISSPQGDAFLARYAPDGTLTWLKQTAGPGGSQPIGARSMAVSSDGSAYVTGDFGEPIQLGDTQLTVTGGDEAFVARYDEHGDVVWARQSNGQGYAVGFSVATIDDGSAYVAGEFGGSVSLGAKQLEGRGESGFVAKYLADGSVDWITTGTGRSAILSVVTDSDGSAYLTGGFSGAAAFGDIDFGGHLDDFSMFVAKLDPAGMPVWGQQAGGSSWGRAIALQRGCTPQVVGTFVGTWSFGSTQWSSRGQEDAFLVSLEPVVESRSIAVEPMSYARHAHTATLLQNQQVLVTGGFGSTAWLSSAELYDTSTRSWNPASSMLEARTNHTSSLLKNGKVLVAGGLSPQGAQPSGALTSAELYDPAEDAWESTGSLHEPRGQHTATVIQNGKVLVVGGVAATGINNLASAELYDPATRKWSAAGTLTAPRMQTTATLLLDGRVLVAGGINNAGPEFLSGCELYDPASNDWSPAAPLSQPRRDHAAVLLANGKVLVVAGDNTSGDLATAELYDPSTNTWQATGSLRAPRSEPTATLLLDGSVLLLGGARNSGPTFLSTVERYDPSRGVWRADTPMSHAHYSHTATLLDQGHVLVTGGFDGNDFVSNVDLYLPGQSTLDE
jgi:N-acetylneuraminic acid mutarotase